MTMRDHLSKANTSESERRPLTSLVSRPAALETEFTPLSPSWQSFCGEGSAV
jgi:hypothetical protein